jgi:hypothetical protein
MYAYDFVADRANLLRARRVAKYHGAVIQRSRKRDFFPNVSGTSVRTSPI